MITMSETAQPQTESTPTPLNRGENAAAKRFGKFNRQAFKNQAALLNAMAEKLYSFSTVMAAFGVDELKIDGSTKFSRACDELEKYLENVESALKDQSRLQSLVKARSKPH